MRKSYLFLMMLFVQLIMGGMAFAADPPKAEYDAAIAAIPSGAYYITTEVDGVKYYVTSSGSLEERYEGIESSEGLFTINQDEGGALYNVGWHIEGANGHFSNTTLSDSKAVLNPGTGVFRLDTGNNRHDWESQVFFMNEEGKIAIRSCNTAYAESSWADAGRAFWTYQVDEVGEIVWGDFGPMPAYSYEPAYIWTLEVPTGADEVKVILNGIYDKYLDHIDDYDGWSMNLGIGTEFGQYSDAETWEKFVDLIGEVEVILNNMVADDYDYYSDPDALTPEEAKALAATADSLFQVVLDSEVPYMIPQNGYYRIYAVKRYASTFDESGFVDKAIAAAYVDEHKDKAVLGTVKKNLASYLWKLTKSEEGDSIIIQNAGMGTYISFSSDVTDNKVFMTDDPADASCVMFDYAGNDYVQPGGVDDYKDLFAIRLAGTKKGTDGRYIHQMNHSSYDSDSSPWGSYGKDLGSDQELGFWIRTFDTGRTTDKYCSEWYLEYVDDAEAEEIIADFEVIKNHDVLVAKNNALREEVAAALETAKDAIKTAQITSVDQLTNTFGDPSEGQNIGNLIDGDPATFWHTTWHGLSEGMVPMYYLNGSFVVGEDQENEEALLCHYLPISGTENLVGNCELFLQERASADNDRVKTLVLLGADDPNVEDNEWEEILKTTLPHTGQGETNNVHFFMQKAYPYLRLVVIEVDSKSYAFRSFWHAAEIQLYLVEDNPNSQFAALGEVAEELENIYNANVATADEDITPEMYQALLDAFKAFNAGMVDPTELRDALAKYADLTKGVVEGANPGEWIRTNVASEFDTLLAEAAAYDKAGRYTAQQNHKYAVMLKAMQKSVMEQANGIKTDKWYRIMVPTEEMYDAFDFSKEGVDKCGDLIEDQWSICGNFVTAAKLESEEETVIDDETGEEKTVTTSWLEAIGGENLRESDRLFFMAEDEIEDKDASMFRFVEQKADDSDCTPLFLDAKENMAMALDMSTTYTRGEALITKGAQFSSNASYPGSDGQKLESGCLIDGNTATYWHSDYSKTYCEVPYLQVALNEPVSGLIQVYVARRNTNNGHVVRMYVQGSNDAETWTNVGYIETPYTNATTPVYSQPIDLGGTFSHLRFTMTNRYGTDGGSNIEFDPFAEDLTADDYNTKFTYFHASEFQVYPVTEDQPLTGSAKVLQNAFNVANKVVLKDATAEDLAAAANGYRNYRSEFNAEAGKDVLPYGKEKVDPVYALQNKATGLFVMVSGTGNQNNIYLKTIPSLVGYKALGYQRSLMSAKTVDGVSCNNFHAGESNRRFCTWNSTEPTSNSGLVICEAEEAYEAPAEFTFFKDIKPGRIADWCHSVTITPVDAPEDANAYTAVGWYRDEDDALFLALNAIETIPAGEPALYIFGDTTEYDAEDEYVEPVKFKISGDEKPVLEGTTVNGLMGTLATYTLKNEIYFNGNYAAWPAEGASVAVTPCSAVLNLAECPEVDSEGEYDFSICIAADPDDADGVEDITTAIEKISQRGDVYSMDGKLLRTGATLNSLKALGKGMYILNGVKVVVK